jgi:ABC-type multidrug transport system ATPase subunit
MRAEPSVLPLRLEGVGFAVGGGRLLAGIDLVVRPGRRLVVLGPNGAGKTLLLRICHGLLAPTEGRVSWALPELAAERQHRLALARAWARRPQVMFLDEPCSQTDPGATRTIEAAIRGLADEGITVAMTTHDLGQARRLAEEVAFLHRGRLVESGPADGFFARPRSAEARTFLAGELPW